MGAYHIKSLFRDTSIVLAIDNTFKTGNSIFQGHVFAWENR